MKYLLPSLLLAATIGVIAPVNQADAAILVFSTTLSGANESPPNTSTATGTATVTIDDILHTMRVETTFSGLSGNNTAAHIHSATLIPGQGTAGVATPTPTFPGFPSGTSGSYDQLFDMTLASSYRAGFITANGGTPATAEVALFDGIRAGKAYFNIHTAANPGGEIRGFFTQVPEPSSTLGFLALCTIGTVATLKRRQ